MSIATSRTRYKRSQEGFSMIEVLITVLVSAIGLIGMAGLQITSIKTTTVSVANTQAMIAINEIIDLMRVDFVAASNGEFNIDALDSNGTLRTFSATTAPSGTPTLAETMTYTWFKNLDRQVSGVKAGVNCSNLGMCAIKIELSDSVGGQAQVISVQL